MYLKINYQKKKKNTIYLYFIIYQISEVNRFVIKVHFSPVSSFAIFKSRALLFLMSSQTTCVQYLASSSNVVREACRAGFKSPCTWRRCCVSTNSHMSRASQGLWEGPKALEKYYCPASSFVIWQGFL